MKREIIIYLGHWAFERYLFLWFFLIFLLLMLLQLKEEKHLKVLWRHHGLRGSTEQHYVSIFFTRLWSVLFRYMGRLVTNQQKLFSISSSFLLAVWFCIYTHPQLRILKFQDSVYQKTEVCAQTINRVKKIETQCCSVTQTINHCDGV